MNTLSIPFAIVALLVLTLADLAIAQSQDMPDSMCARAIPEPILNHSIFSDSKFVLRSPMEGIETATLKNGDHITIRNYGCEYYNLDLQFDIVATERSTTHLGSWYAISAKELLAIAPGNKAPVKFAKIATILRRVSRHPVPLHHEIEIEPGEIRTSITLQQIKVRKDRAVVMLTIVIGPL